MRVVLDATTLDGGPSGAATRLAALGAALAARHDVHASYLVRPGVDPLPGLPCASWAGAARPWGRARMGPRLDDHLAAAGADLFHAAALPLPRLRRHAQVLTVHDLRFLHPDAGQGWLRRLWARRRLRPNLARAVGVVAVSETTRDELVSRGLFRAEAVAVAPNARTPGLVATSSVDAIAAFRRRADLNCRFLLSLGPLAAHKRVGDALELLSLVRRHPDGADLGLVFAGRADPEATLTVARRAERLGLGRAVRVVGVLDAAQLSVALSGAEALLVLGRSEGFSIPVVDAQALGLPVVGVAAGALPEVAGDGAWLVAPGDLAGLAAAVLDAVQPGDLREARLSRGFALASRWSWDASAEALVRFWRTVLGRGSPAG